MRLCDNRRSAGAGQERKQLGASYPGFRGGSAPARVLPMRHERGVRRTFRFPFGARGPPESNAEPPGVPEHRTGKRPEHRTRDTGPDRTPDLNPLTRINLQAVRGEGAPGEPTLDQVAQSPE